MTDYQRISEVINYLKLNARVLSSMLGLKSPQVFYDIKAGKCGISKDLAFKIQEKFFNINAAWLLTGEGEMLKDPNPTQEEIPIGEHKDKTEVERLIALLEKKDKQIDKLLHMLEKEQENVSNALKGADVRATQSGSYIAAG